MAARSSLFRGLFLAASLALAPLSALASDDAPAQPAAPPASAFPTDVTTQGTVDAAG